MSRYEDPVELDLVKIKGQYWVVNDDDFDVQSQTESDLSHSMDDELRKESEGYFEVIGHVKIPRCYFTNESGPHVA